MVAAHQENAAKLPLKAQTGWSVQNDHPVRAFLTVLMARPPLLSQEGPNGFPTVYSCLDRNRECHRSTPYSFDFVL